MQSSAKIRFIAAAAFALATALSAQTPQHAQVTYTGGQLSVSANNSSLNQILHDISHETGMKITGGVTDERVFGQYGPASPDKILGQLLDGTGSNMLLVHATTAAPAELVLTPRHGAPTPPNPEAYREDPASPPVRPQYPIAPEENAAPNPPVAPSPNAIKTPQQIYEQLQRMRQEQQQSNPQEK
jgi:hypothetical protein